MIPQFSKVPEIQALLFYEDRFLTRHTLRTVDTYIRTFDMHVCVHLRVVVGSS